MDKAVAMLAEDVATIRTGRAVPGLIENIEVSVYEGQKMKLKQLGSIGVADARTLVFQPWDVSQLAQIKNSLAAANLGATPVVEGQVVRISLPMLTVEQREDYVKLLGRKLEGARGVLRDMRAEERRALMDAKQKGEISEDEFKRDEEALQKLTDEYNGKLESLAEKKEKEIREI